MNTLIHADIFFFIASIAFVVISICALVAIIYLIKILRDFSQVSQKVKEESGEIIADLHQLRGSIKAQGFGFTYVKDIVKLMFKKRRKSKSE